MHSIRANSMIVVVVAICWLATSHSHAWWFEAEQKQQQQQQQQPAGPRAALATFHMDGVKGTFRFDQKAPGEPTKISYDLHGLQGNNQQFHIHVQPVPQYDAAAADNNQTLREQLCGAQATGGHLNPHHITAKLPPKSAPQDQYELGDLSGKFGPLLEMAGHQGHYFGFFVDSKVALSGEHNVIGRSVVIHKNDGKRWVCANINEIKL